MTLPYLTDPKRTAGIIRRFWARVAVSEDGCWLWTGFRNEYGYGVATLAGGRDGKPAATGAHRVAWQYVKGSPPPPELTLDHLCRVRHCVNPAHLEPVTRGENTLRSPITLTAINRRKTHCIRGHSLAEAGISTRADGRTSRYCVACSHANGLAHYYRKKAARLAARDVA